VASIVAAATAWDDSGRSYDTGLRCARTRGRGRCRGYLRVTRDIVRVKIEWRCASCGDEGLLVNWENSDGDLRRIWPLPPWAVATVEGMADEYVRMHVGAKELTFLQWISGFDEGLWNVVYAARRDGRRFLIVGPDWFCGILGRTLREWDETGRREAALARRLRRRLARARRMSRARRAGLQDGFNGRRVELGEGPLRN
jgi:hypothetical protein